MSYANDSNADYGALGAEEAADNEGARPVEDIRIEADNFGPYWRHGVRRALNTLVNREESRFLSSNQPPVVTYLIKSSHPFTATTDKVF